jgi:hypothetical protein
MRLGGFILRRCAACEPGLRTASLNSSSSDNPEKRTHELGNESIAFVRSNVLRPRLLRPGLLPNRLRSFCL